MMRSRRKLKGYSSHYSPSFYATAAKGDEGIEVPSEVLAKSWFEQDQNILREAAAVARRREAGYVEGPGGLSEHRPVICAQLWRR